MYQNLSWEEKQKRKIMFYIGNLARGGAQRVVVNLSNYFVQEGYEVAIVTAKREKGEYPYDKKIIRIISDLTPEEETNYRTFNFLKRICKLRGIWKQHSPDIIISFMGKSNIFTLLSSRLLGIPVLVSVRSAPEREYAGFINKFLSKTLFTFASGIILQTEDALKYFPGYIRKKAVVMPNSIDPKYIKSRCPYDKRKNEIVSVGAIDTNKNHEILIDAFAHISYKYPEMKLTIYGEGHLRKTLIEKVDKLKMEDKIFLPGREYEIYNKIWDSRVFVLTSNAEGMPNALIEAMAMGLAVISTDCPCGGPKALINNGENGLLIPVQDVEALTKALRTILENRDLEEKMGQNAYSLSEELAPAKVNKMWQEYIESKMRND